MTIILGPNHQVYYYFGLNAPDDPSIPVPPVYATNFGLHGIRAVLLGLKQQELIPVVFIKSTSQARYRDLINILDELNITSWKKYALVALPASDSKLLQQAGYYSAPSSRTEPQGATATRITRLAVSRVVAWRRGPVPAGR